MDAGFLFILFVVNKDFVLFESKLTSHWLAHFLTFRISAEIFEFSADISRHLSSAHIFRLQLTTSVISESVVTRLMTRMTEYRPDSELPVENTMEGGR